MEVQMQIEATGPFACFTRPESRSERMSYPFITPSAAIAIVSSILWKPEIRWEVSKIEVLQNIQFINVKKNELKGSAIIRRASAPPIDITKHREQRNSSILKDVAYRITFEPYLTDKGRSDRRNTISKYKEQFQRRLEKGQFFHLPYFGCREFTAFVKPATKQKPIRYTSDFGFMFYNRFYPDDNPELSQKVKMFFFRAVMNEGVVLVPSRKEIMGVYA